MQLKTRRRGAYTPPRHFMVPILGNPSPDRTHFPKHLTTMVLPPCYEYPRVVGLHQEGFVDTIEIPIDDAILAQLDALVPVVGASEAVRELGITVTRETVARLALVRGLRDSNLAPPPPGPCTSKVRNAASSSGPAQVPTKPRPLGSFGPVSKGRPKTPFWVWASSRR